MSDVVVVTEQTFQAEVLDSKVPVVVDFWAAWCAPCLMVAPTLEKLAAEMKGKVKFTKLDVDSNRSIAGQFGIQGIPTLIFFRDGKAVDQRVGVSSEADLRAAVERLGSSS